MGFRVVSLGKSGTVEEEKEAKCRCIHFWWQGRPSSIRSREDSKWNAGVILETTKRMNVAWGKGDYVTVTFGSGFTVLTLLEPSLLEPVLCFGIQEAVGRSVGSAPLALSKRDNIVASQRFFCFCLLVLLFNEHVPHKGIWCNVRE